MITVTGSSGRTESIDGTGFEVNGMCVLTILGNDGVAVAAYAPGSWQSAVVAPAAAAEPAAPGGGT